MTPAPELREALARALAINDGWTDPDALWTENLSVIAAGGQGEPVFHEYYEDADRIIPALLAGPLSDLTRQAAEAQRERDEARARIASIYGDRILANDGELNADPQLLIRHLEQQCRDFIQERDEWKAVANREAATALAETARLQAEIEGLRAALKPFADEERRYHDCSDRGLLSDCARSPLRVGHLRTARAALNPETARTQALAETEDERKQRVFEETDRQFDEDMMPGGFP